jgi:hypothetical protein
MNIRWSSGNLVHIGLQKNMRKDLVKENRNSIKRDG